MRQDRILRSGKEIGQVTEGELKGNLTFPIQVLHSLGEDNVELDRSLSPDQPFGSPGGIQNGDLLPPRPQVLEAEILNRLYHRHRLCIGESAGRKGQTKADGQGPKARDPPCTLTPRRYACFPLHRLQRLMTVTVMSASKVSAGAASKAAASMVPPIYNRTRRDPVWPERSAIRLVAQEPPLSYSSRPAVVPGSVTEFGAVPTSYPHSHEFTASVAVDVVLSSSEGMVKEKPCPSLLRR